MDVWCFAGVEDVKVGGSVNIIYYLFYPRPDLGIAPRHKSKGRGVELILLSSYDRYHHCSGWIPIF